MAREGATKGAASVRAAAAALRWLPRSWLSRQAGRLAALRLPAPLQRLEIRAFGAAVGVDFDEARDPVDAYESLQAFFTRALREGARPVDPAADAFVGPCDGSWGASGQVQDGTLLQLKGRRYSLARLLGGGTAERFEGGPFATLYLSPRDYHRFHAPCDVTVERAVFVPGTLWPVNRWGVEGIDGVFAENERIVAFLRPRGAPPGAELCIAAVGATLVGRVRVEFDELGTRDGAPRTERHYEPPPAFAKGAEWGRFEFGSTLVLVATPGWLALDAEAPGAPVRLGRRIGRMAR